MNTIDLFCNQTMSHDLLNMPHSNSMTTKEMKDSNKRFTTYAIEIFAGFPKPNAYTKYNFSNYSTFL